MQKPGLWRDHGLGFPSIVGNPSHRNALRALKELLKRTGLPATVRLYDPLHACATLLSRNVHLKYVQELLEYASIALTLHTYSHVLPSVGGGVSGAMEDALG